MSCNNIVQYTTPTIQVEFKTVDPTDIVEAYLTFKYNTGILLTLDISAAEIGEHAISWTLAQEQSKLLPVGSTVRVYCDWKLTDGTRGRSHRAEYRIIEPGKEAVM